LLILRMLKILNKLAIVPLMALLVQAQIDPSTVIKNCLGEGLDLDTCSERTFEAVRPYMASGLNGAGLVIPVPSMDPMAVDKIVFNFVNGSVENLNIVFLNMEARGLQMFDLVKTHIDKQTREWELDINVPGIQISGEYEMSGTYGIDLGVSKGDLKFNAENVKLVGKATLGNNQGKIDIKTLDLKVDFDSPVKIEMDCLFPSEEGSCCPENWRRSCSQGLARAIHGLIEKEDGKFVDKFKPQISVKFSELMLDYLKRILQNLEAEYAIHV